MSRLPSGSVTFLFTDIEGSTRRWEHDQRAMQHALDRHNRLLHQAIGTHRGSVFKTVGDAFCAAFDDAGAALRAALFAQRTLAAGPWGETGPLRVRMALHTAMAEAQDNDYFGPAVNRVARLLSTGHGAQVLLSRATVEQVRDSLPEGVSLLDLGSHRLKDLSRPEHVFQLVVPDLPAEFSPLKSLDNRPNNLPTQPTSLLGRDHDVAEATATLRREDVRLLTLIGPGGIGKTRLALQIAADVADEFADGIWFVDLSALRESNLVIPEIARTLGIREEGKQSLRDRLAAALRDESLLLVLDNCEQVLGAAPEVAELLAACPNVKALATSRAPLRVRGERELRVPPLALPDLQRALPLDVLIEVPAVRLFAERATAVRAGFTVTAENAAVVTAICVRLDGLPLAIELAAARTRLLAPQQLLARLEQRLPHLVGGSRDLPARQQTLRATIDWSHDLLTTDEQTLFRRLAVFVGGWTLDAAEAVVESASIPGLDVLAGLEGLAEQSLLRAEEATDGGLRFRMLETIREFAIEQLEASDEADRIRRAHAVHVLDFAEHAASELAGAKQAAWLALFEAEHDNLRSAVAWTHDTGDAAMAARLTAALTGFWRNRGHLSEAQAWIERTLAWGDEVGRDQRAQLLNDLGNVVCDRGDYARGESVYGESLALRRDMGDERGVADVLGNLALLATDKGDYARARSLHEESLAIRRGLGDRRRLAFSLVNLGGVAHRQGDLSEAATLLDEALALFRELGDQTRIAYALTHLGIVARHRGNREQARASFEEALALYEAVGFKEGIAGGLANLGNVAQAEGDLDRATQLHERALALHRELGNRLGEAVALGNLAALAYHCGDHVQAAATHGESLGLHRLVGNKRGIVDALANLAHISAAVGEPGRAARLYGAAGALRDLIGAAIPLAERAEYDRQVSGVRQQLGEAAFADAWEAGRALPLEAAIDEALQLTGGDPVDGDGSGIHMTVPYAAASPVRR